MPRTRTAVVSTLTAATLLAVLSVPAAASDLDAEFTVSAPPGGLSVSTAAARDVLTGTQTNLLSAATITDSMPAVTVTDNRAATLGSTWALQVGGTAWANRSNTTITIPASASRVYLPTTDVVAYTLGGVLGGMTVLAGEGSVGTNHLGAAYVLLNGTTAPLLTGSVTFTPSIDIRVPVGAAVGIYDARVTYTVS